MTANKENRNIQHYSVDLQGWCVLCYGIQPTPFMARYVRIHLRARVPARTVYVRMER